MFSSPGFVDHHAHAFWHFSGVAPPWGEEGLEGYHKRLGEVGSSPTDEGPGLPPDVPPVEVGVLRAHRVCAELGLTEIWEAGFVPQWLIDAHLRLLERLGRFDVRVRLLAGSGYLDQGGLPRPTGDPWFDVVGVKFYMDGWLRARTCAVHEPFADRPGGTGVLFMDSDALARRADPVAKAGLKVVVHTIGGRAIDAALTALQKVAAGQRLDPAPRLEHVQDLNEDLVGRMADQGVEACVQPSFASSDVVTAQKAFGPGAAHSLAYKWSALLDAGVRVVTGSDYPVEDLSPLVGLRDLVRGPVDPLATAVALRCMTDAGSGRTWLSADPKALPLCDFGQVKVLGTEPAGGADASIPPSEQG